MEEEVWNELSLSSPFISLRSPAVHHSLLNFQDFLDHRPFSNRNPQPPLNDGGAPATELRLGTCTGALLSSPPVKKRVLYVGDSNEEERHKRLMKNRESGDRSRARKQAYTMELEKEVERLKKENAKLKGQLKMILTSKILTPITAKNKSNSEGYPQLPKKHTLRRTLTAPF